MMIYNKCQIKQNNDVLIRTMLQKSHKNGNNNDSNVSRSINNRCQNRFRKSSPCYNRYKPSSKNKAKCYFRHSLQRSLSMGIIIHIMDYTRGLSIFLIFTTIVLVFIPSVPKFLDCLSNILF